MFGTQHLALFLLSGILLNMTPGQDTLYIVARSLAQGRRAGLLSALGISCGCVVHTCAAAFGLSAILATSASAFMVIKLVGAEISHHEEHEVHEGEMRIGILRVLRGVRLMA